MASEDQDKEVRGKETLKPEDDEVAPPGRFPAEEEATLLQQCNTQKAEANKLFGSSDYGEAIQGYDKALSFCPNYLDYEIAVLRSNIAACHLKLEDWKAAIDSATQSLEALDRVDPPSKTKKNTGDSSVIEEVDHDTAEKIEALNRSGRSRNDVQKIRVKVLLRRAKARTELGGWAELQGADEDYKKLSATPDLTPLDRKVVQRALVELPPRLEAAKQKEMGDMMGKLKELGNGILKPFGLSTDNFNFIKDEATGGYNMQFNQGGN